MTFSKNFLKKVICIDTETTGLNLFGLLPDECLQISIIDGFGNTLFNAYGKPRNHDEWFEAYRINGISPKAVADKPHFSFYRNQIQSIIDTHPIVIGYNLPFDMDMMSISIPDLSFKKSEECIDVMSDFAEIYGEIRDDGNYKFQKLSTCAQYYGYKSDAKFHNSLEDAKATLYCFLKMKEAIKQAKAS